MKREVVRRLKIGVTYRCNGRCRHCAMRRYPERPKSELTRAEIGRIANEGRLLGVDTIVIFGGEPTVREDILDIVRLLADIVPNVFLDSNGLLVDEPYAQALRRAGLTRIQISLDGPDRETHADMRGMDSFEEVTRAIRASVAVGLDTHVLTTTSRGLLKDGGLERLLDLTRSLGTHAVRLLYPALAGNWAEERAELLTLEEMQYVKSLVDGDYVYLEAEGQREYHCAAIYGGYYYVSPHGDVQPCYFVPFSMGNLRRETLGEVARRATFDVPALGGGAVFNDDKFPCIMTHLRAQDIFSQADEPLVGAKWDNVVDLGGGRLGDGRPEATFEAAADRIKALAQQHRHVYVCGGDPAARDDFPALAERLAEGNVEATLVGDPRTLYAAHAAGQTNDVTIRRVIVPLLGATSDGVPGIRLSPGDFPEFARATAGLRAARIPLEFELIEWSPGMAPPLRALLALHPEEITNVVLAERDGGPAAGEPAGDGSDGAAHRAAARFPNHDLLRRQTIAIHGRALEPYDTDEAHFLAPESFLDPGWKLAGILGPNADSCRTVSFTVDVKHLVKGLGNLARAMPRFATAGHRVIVRCVGPTDQKSATGAVAPAEGHDGSSPESQARRALARLLELERQWPNNLQTFGCGPDMFRPWTTLAALREELDDERYVATDSDNEGVSVATLLRAASMRSADPPAADAATADPWCLAGTGWEYAGWTFQDRALQQVHAVLAAATAASEAEAPDQGREALASLEPEARSPEAVLRLCSRLLDGLDDDADLLDLMREDAGGASVGTLRQLDERFRALLALLVSRPQFPFADHSVAPPGEMETDPDGWRLVIALVRDERRVEILLQPASDEHEALFRGEHVGLSYTACEGDAIAPPEQRALSALGDMADWLWQRITEDAAESPAPQGLDATVTRYDETHRGTVEASAGASPEEAVRTPGSERLSSQLPLIRRIAESLERAPRSPLPGWRLTGIEEREDADGYAIDMAFVSGSEPLKLSLLAADVPRPAVAQGRHVKLLHAPETTPSRELIGRGLPSLCRVFDIYLDKTLPTRNQ